MAVAALHEDQHADHGPSQTGWSMQNVVMGMALTGAVVAAGVILAPHMLPAIGLGDGELAKEAMFVLHNETTGSGLAGTLNSVLSQVPLIGSELAKGGLFNAVASGVVGVGGVLAGNSISKRFSTDGGRLDWGKVVKWAALGTSALIALPTVLTGLGYGLIYLTSQFGSSELANNVIDWVAQNTGTIAYDSTMMAGLSGAATTLPHLLTCGLSFVPASLGFCVDAISSKIQGPSQNREIQKHPNYLAYNTKQEETSFVARTVTRPLQPDDLNNTLNSEQKAWVNHYNEVSTPKKIALQKWFRELGYDPDFHSDGTMHLHKHPRSQSI